MLLVSCKAKISVLKLSAHLTRAQKLLVQVSSSSVKEELHDYGNSFYNTKYLYRNFSELSVVTISAKGKEKFKNLLLTKKSVVRCELYVWIVEPPPEEAMTGLGSTLITQRLCIALCVDRKRIRGVLMVEVASSHVSYCRSAQRESCVPFLLF